MQMPADNENTNNRAKKQPDSVEIVRRRVAKKLKGFTPDFPANLNPWDMSSHRPDAKAFPVPELILFMLRNLMGWPWQGRGEKVRWTVYGSIDGEAVGFELRKSGFTVLRVANQKVPESRIIGQLRTALKDIETLLEPFAQVQVDQGNVLIVNRLHEFEDRHKFFRVLANKAYAKAKNSLIHQRAATSMAEGYVSGILDQFSHSMSANREGFFYSAAMVDAYFSALEHRLVLLRAFKGAPLAPGELKKILSSRWDDKLKAVLPTAGDKNAESILNKMRRIKERIRNPFAHGGVENDGGSLFFHLPYVGAIPANFSQFGDSVRFTFVPIEADDHAECCATFDELDKLLSTGGLTGPHHLMVAGIDPSFDPKSLKSYAEASSGGEDELQMFISAWSRGWEEFANMDY